MEEEEEKAEQAPTGVLFTELAILGGATVYLSKALFSRLIASPDVVQTGPVPLYDVTAPVVMDFEQLQAAAPLVDLTQYPFPLSFVVQEKLSAGNLMTSSAYSQGIDRIRLAPGTTAQDVLILYQSVKSSVASGFNADRLLVGGGDGHLENLFSGKQVGFWEYVQCERMPILKNQGTKITSLKNLRITWGIAALQFMEQIEEKQKLLTTEQRVEQTFTQNFRDETVDRMLVAASTGGSISSVTNLVQPVLYLVQTMQVEEEKGPIKVDIPACVELMEELECKVHITDVLYESPWLPGERVEAIEHLVTEICNHTQTPAVVYNTLAMFLVAPNKTLTKEDPALIYEVVTEYSKELTEARGKFFSTCRSTLRDVFQPPSNLALVAQAYHNMKDASVNDAVEFFSPLNVVQHVMSKVTYARVVFAGVLSHLPGGQSLQKFMDSNFKALGETNAIKAAAVGAFASIGASVSVAVAPSALMLAQGSALGTRVATLGAKGIEGVQTAGRTMKVFLKKGLDKLKRSFARARKILSGDRLEFAKLVAEAKQLLDSVNESIAKFGTMVAEQMANMQKYGKTLIKKAKAAGKIAMDAGSKAAKKAGEAFEFSKRQMEHLQAVMGPLVWLYDTGWKIASAIASGIFACITSIGWLCNCRSKGGSNGNIEDLLDQVLKKLEVLEAKLEALETQTEEEEEEKEEEEEEKKEIIAKNSWMHHLALLPTWKSMVKRKNNDHPHQSSCVALLHLHLLLQL